MCSTPYVCVDADADDEMDMYVHFSDFLFMDWNGMEWRGGGESIGGIFSGRQVGTLRRSLVKRHSDIFFFFYDLVVMICIVFCFVSVLRAGAGGEGRVMGFGIGWCMVQVAGCI